MSGGRVADKSSRRLHTWDKASGGSNHVGVIVPLALAIRVAAPRYHGAWVVTKSGRGLRQERNPQYSRVYAQARIKKLRVASTITIPAWVLLRKTPPFAVPMSMKAEMENEDFMLNGVVRRSLGSLRPQSASHDLQ